LSNISPLAPELVPIIYSRVPLLSLIIQLLELPPVFHLETIALYFERLSALYQKVTLKSPLLSPLLSGNPEARFASVMERY
jgi:hypothetical protein